MNVILNKAKKMSTESLKRLIKGFLFYDTSEAINQSVKVTTVATKEVVLRGGPLSVDI
jgi:hypothetical protein